MNPSKRSIVAVLLVLGAGFVAMLAVFARDEEVRQPRQEELQFEPLGSVQEVRARASLGLGETALADEASTGRIATSPSEDLSPVAGRSRLRARFIDPEGLPVAGVLMSASGKGSAKSDADGRVAFELDPPEFEGVLAVRFGLEGYASDLRVVQVAAGDESDLGDVRLAFGGAISGRVVDPSGAALAGVRVHALGALLLTESGGVTSRSHSHQGSVEALTDELGGFRLVDTLAGQVQLQVTSAAKDVTGEHSVEVKPGQETLGVVVVATSIPVDTRIEGVVLDPRGEPVPFVSVRAEWESWFSGGSQNTMTDHAGRFRMVCANDNERDLDFRDPEGRYTPVRLESVSVGTLDVLARFEQTQGIYIGVVDTNGVAVEASARITVSADGGQRTLQAIDAQLGAAPAALLLPREPFTVEVSAEGFDTERLGPLIPASVTAGQTLHVALRPLPGLRGTVSAAGQPLADARLIVRELAQEAVWIDGLPSSVAAGERAQGVSDASGVFALTLRDGGRFVLRAQADGFAPTELGPFDYLPRLGLAGLELELSEGGAIEGRVQLADRGVEPWIIAASRGDGYARTARVDREGKFRFEHLIPGGWNLSRVAQELHRVGSRSETADGGAFGEPPASCQVVEGRTTYVDFPEAGAQTIVALLGRLRVDGGPAAHWTASLRARNASPFASDAGSTSLDENGAFRLDPNKEGDYLLLLRELGEGAAMVFAEVSLPVGENSWEHELERGTLELQAPLVAGEVPSVEALPLYLRSSGAGGVLTLQPVPVQSEGVQRLEAVPVGALDLVRFDPAAPEDPRNWPVLQKFTVPAGPK